jgi:transcriptional regulator
MYTPKHFQEANIGAMHALMRSHPLATWVVHANGELNANHVPFMLDAAAGEHGTLIGHVARNNPVWQSLSDGVSSLVIFQGPDAYISPSWYASKGSDGKVVPTWNYAVVHAHGCARAIHDRNWLHALVQRLTDTHEARQAVPWKVSDAPDDYIQRMLDAIVGIEIPISKLIGKWKVSQNRSTEDRAAVVKGLFASDDMNAKAMAELVRAHD